MRGRPFPHVCRKACIAGIDRLLLWDAKAGVRRRRNQDGGEVLEKDKTVPEGDKQQWIADILAGEIAAGKWGKGAKLPSESELGRRFGVNKLTANKAVGILVGRKYCSPLPRPRRHHRPLGGVFRQGVHWLLPAAEPELFPRDHAGGAAGGLLPRLPDALFRRRMGGSRAAFRKTPPPVRTPGDDLRPVRFPRPALPPGGRRQPRLGGRL